MITTDLVSRRLKGSPFQHPAIPRARGEAWLAGYRERDPEDAAEWELLAVLSCACCGEAAWPNGRCTKHQNRNPCVVEGCKRTGKASADTLRTDVHLCGEHWKLYCPAGSPERRAINRLFRLAKKAGYTRTEVWPYQLEQRYWRLWMGALRRVRRRSTAGHLDQAEIERMFGWADAGP